MQAIAVNCPDPSSPPAPDSAHLRDDVPEPSLDEIPDGRGVLFEPVHVGVDGTDKEINAGLYGKAPTGCDFLIIGHECIGRVAAVGPNVPDLQPGDFVTPTVRRPRSEDSDYDRLFHQDNTPLKEYVEHGIRLRHGFLCERVVERAEYLVKVPPGPVAEIGVLMEPMSIVQKALRIAYDTQRRLPIKWEPKRALVTGAGPLGQLAALALRLREMAVVVVARTPGAHLKSRLLSELGAEYRATENRPLKDILGDEEFDLIFEASGSAAVAFEILIHLANNGVCMFTTVSAGTDLIPVAANEINFGLVLGNKAVVGMVNAHRDDFIEGIRDFSVATYVYPGWLPKLLSHPFRGLASCNEMMHELAHNRATVKVYNEIGPGE